MGYQRRVHGRLSCQEAFVVMMQKTFQSFGLWKPNPEFPPETHIHWQDLDQDFEAIAAQLFNYMQIRPKIDDEIYAASFVADFGFAYGYHDTTHKKNVISRSNKFVEIATKYAEEKEKEVPEFPLLASMKHIADYIQNDDIIAIGMGTLALGVLGGVLAVSWAKRRQ